MYLSMNFSPFQLLCPLCLSLFYLIFLLSLSLSLVLSAGHRSRAATRRRLARPATPLLIKWSALG